MKKQYVYQLQHSRHVEPDGDDWVNDTKLLGCFSTRLKAEKAIRKYKNVVGFKGYPNDFVIERIKVDFDDYDFI